MEITLHINKVKLVQCILYLHYHFNMVKNTNSVRTFVNDTIEYLKTINGVDNVTNLLQIVSEVLNDFTKDNIKHTNYYFAHDNNYIRCFIEHDKSINNPSDVIHDTINLDSGIWVSYIESPNKVKVEVK